MADEQIPDWAVDSPAASQQETVPDWAKDQPPKSAVEQGLEPITSYPKTVSDIASGAIDTVKQGVKQLDQSSIQSSTGVGNLVKGLGNVVGGGLSWAAAPISAAATTLAGRPVEKVATALGASPRAASALGAGAEAAATFALPMPKVAPRARPLPPAEDPFGVTLGEHQMPGATWADQRAVADALRGRSGNAASEEAGARQATQQAQVAAAPNVAAARLSPTGDVLAEDANDAGQVIGDVLAQQRRDADQAAARRSQQLNAERESIRGSFGPNGRVIAATPQEGADIVAGGLSRAEEQATAARDAAYDRVADLSRSGLFEPKAFTKIADTVKKQAFGDPNDPFVLGNNTPNVNSALEHLDAELGAPARTAVDPKVKSFSPFTSSRVENVRKTLNAYWRNANNVARSTNDYSDVAGMSRLIDAFDDSVSSAYRNKKLFTNADGDAVADALDAARASHATLRRTFSPQGKGDVVGPVISKILGQREGQAAAPGEVTRLTTGSGNTPVQVGRRLLQVFGDDSPEIGATKQALWSKAVEPGEGLPPYDAETIANNVDKLRNSDLGQLYFSPAERARMQGHAAATRAAIPTRDASVLGRALDKAQGKTPQELADMVLPRGGAYDKAESLALAQHLMRTAAPEQRVAIKQGLFRSLIEPPGAESSARTVTRIDNAFKRGQDVMDALYTPEDQQMIKEFRNLHQRLRVPQNVPQWSSHPNYVQAGMKAFAFYVGQQLARPIVSNVPFAEDVAGLAAAKYAGQTSERRAAQRIRQLMPMAGERMAEYQKAVKASEKTQLPAYATRAAIKGTAVMDAFRKLGINLQDWLGSPVPAGAEEQQQQRQAGGAVEDDSGEDDWSKYVGPSGVPRLTIGPPSKSPDPDTPPPKGPTGSPSWPSAAPPADDEPSGGPTPERRGIMEQLTGLKGNVREPFGGEEEEAAGGTRPQPEAVPRFQTWPERMVRSGATLAHDVAAGEIPYHAGLPAPYVLTDPSTGHTSEEVIERSQDMAALAGVGGAGMAEEGAVGMAGGKPPPGWRTIEGGGGASNIDRVIDYAGMSRKDWMEMNPSDRQRLLDSYQKSQEFAKEMREQADQGAPDKVFGMTPKQLYSPQEMMRRGEQFNIPDPSKLTISKSRTIPMKEGDIAQDMFFVKQPRGVTDPAFANWPNYTDVVTGFHTRAEAENFIKSQQQQVRPADWTGPKIYSDTSEPGVAVAALKNKPYWHGDIAKMTGMSPEEWSTRYSPKEHDAISRWMDFEGLDEANNKLRRSRSPSRDEEGVFKNLSAAINKTPVNQDLTLHRGVSEQEDNFGRVWGKDFIDKLESMKPGDVIHDPGFSATSTGTAAQDYGPPGTGQRGAMMQIKVRQGDHALPIPSGQGEVLLDRNSGFRLDGRNANGDYLMTKIYSDTSKPGMALAALKSDPLYSAAERTIQGAKQTKATASQWAGWLKNQPGVKPEEIENLNLDSLPQGQVTKDQLLQHVADNKTQLNERWLTGKQRIDATEFQNEAADWVRRHYPRVDDESDEFMELAVERMNDLAEEANRNQGFTGDRDSPTAPRFSEWQMPGGDNYRELLLKMPQQSKSPYKVQELGGTHNTGEYEVIDTRTGNFVTGGTIGVVNDFLSKNAPELTQQFRTPHWPDDPNVLLHLRTNDRNIPGVGDSLHLEELQSDWHQKGRKEGYKDPNALKTEDVINSPLGERVTAAFKQGGLGATARNWGSGYDGVAAGKKLRDEGKIDNNQLSDILSFGDQMRKAAKQYGAVPDAPFKDTNDWAALGLKRAIVQAAKEGKDSVSWTPGEKQADRYDLSKHIDSIRPTKNNNGTFDIDFMRKGSTYREGLANNVPPEKLADHVGKDLAGKIIEDDKSGRLKWYKGLDLKVGGQGIKKFYDDLLPNVANKISKKYGAKVEWKDLGFDEPKVDISELDALWYDPKMMKLYGYKPGASRPEFEHDVSRSQLPEYIGTEAAERLLQSGLQNGQHTLQTLRPGEFKLLRSEVAGVKVPVLRLTPQLKEQALKGLPLYSDTSKPGMALAALKNEPLYSAVEKAIQNAPMKKATPEQWSGWLKNQPGVKPEELDWIGMPGDTDRPSYTAKEKSIIQEFQQAKKTPHFDFLDHANAIKQKYGISGSDLESLYNRAIDDSPGMSLKDWTPPPEKPSSLTKEQMLQHVADNKTQLEEKWGGQKLSRDQIERLNQSFEQDADEQLFERWSERNSNRGISDPEELQYEYMKWLNTREGRSALQQEIEDVREENQHKITGTRFSEYQMPGGDNYRELLLKMPTESKPKLSPEESDEILKLLNQDDRAQAGNAAPLNSTQEARLTELQTKAGPPRSIKEQFRTSHWPDDPNTLLHLRMNDRQIPEAGFTVQNVDSGNRSQVFKTREEAEAYQKQLPKSLNTDIVPANSPLNSLHLEELQSDWHQKGRKNGYESDKDSSYDHPMFHVVGHFGERVEGPFSERAIADGVAQRENERNPNAWPVRVEPTTAMPTQKEGAVPDAPFKDTNDWAALGLKRAIVQAAKEGKDSVSWTPGEKQADRYDLSKKVNAIDVRPRMSETGERTRSARIRAVGDQSINLGIDKNGMIDSSSRGDLQGKPLADVVGKDMADKIMSNDTQDIRGPDLKIGGTGIKKFYDDLLPNVANKIGKKYGAKVEWKDISTPYPSFEHWLEENHGGPEGMTKRELTNAQHEYEYERNRNPVTPVNVPVLRLTPQLKEQALKGLPLYSDTSKPGAAMAALESGSKPQSPWKEGSMTTYHGTNATFQPGKGQPHGAFCDNLECYYTTSHFDTAASEYAGKEGNVYSVEIRGSNGNYLDYEKRLSQQHPDVQKAISNIKNQEIKGLLSRRKNPTGHEILDTLTYGEDPAQGIRALERVGIYGMKNRSVLGNVEGSSDYEIFNPKNTKITGKRSVDRRFGGAVRGEQEAFSSTANSNQGGASSGSAFARGGAAKDRQAKGEVPRKVKDEDDDGKCHHWCNLIDARHDVVSGADSTAKRTIIDRHIPKFSPLLRDKRGKPANLHKYLGRHEQAEALGMRSGMSYDDAHAKRGVPAERSAVLGDGVDWKEYVEEMAGYLSHVEHEKVEKPPPKGEHVDPRKAVRRAAGGRVVAANIDHDPTPAQKEAGNYAKDHVKIHGLDVAIENAKGSTRKGVSKDGKSWKSVLPAHYGYVKGTEGADGDHVDVYLGPHLKSDKAWVIDQIDSSSKAFDEHKAFLGFASKMQVVNCYKKAFSDGKGLERIGAIHAMSTKEFKDWLKGDTSKPLSDAIKPRQSMIERKAFQYHEDARDDRCEVCRYWSGPEGCGLFRMLNHRMPEDFNLNSKVAPDGWCSAFTDRSAKE